MLQQDIKYILLLAQVFGLLPVQGIFDDNSDNLSFTWYSKRFIMSWIIILASGFITIMSFCRLCLMGFSLYRLSSFIFNVNSAICGIIFIKLAREWPKLMRKWKRIELSFSDKTSQQKSNRKRYLAVFIIILSAAAIEHILSKIDSFSVIPNDTPDKFKEHYSRNYPHLADFFSFSTPLLIFAMIMNICNVFTWNFMDTFLIIISITLAENFKEISTRIKYTNKIQDNSKYHWIKLRENYNRVVIFCKIMNNKLSTLILVSFTTNMFFITTQLYWSFNRKSSFIESLYPTFSFTFLVLRTVAVVIFASSVNEESKKSLDYLLTLKSDIYNSEIERFAFQIHCQAVALTGHDFFVITKSLLLSMIGSILTYEIFLIQSSGATTYYK